VKAVIQARARRKGLMPIVAVMDFLLHGLRPDNVEDDYITTAYLDHLTRSFGSDGRLWGFNVTYTQELEPLGTAVAYHSLANSSKAPS
jgi:NDP-sugar pyrophosphorylase family protein